RAHHRSGPPMTGRPSRQHRRFGMKKTLLALGLGLALSLGAAAEDKAYTEGTVWNVTLVRVKPGMYDVYLNEVLPMRKKVGEEARKAGLQLSSKVLSGTSANGSDFNIMFL